MIKLISFVADFPHSDVAVRTLNARGVLFRRGDLMRSVHFLLEGDVHLVRGNADGNLVVVQRAVAGSVVAEAALFSECYHCDAISQTRSRVVVVRAGAVRARLDSDEGFRRAWTVHLGREVQQARSRCELLSLKGVSERLDAWLALQDRQLPPKGEWRSIAEEIGVRPETLYRELARRRRDANYTGE